jgi:penicillin-binding protein 2
VILPPVDPNLEHQSTGTPPLRDDTNFASGKIAIFQYAAVVIFLFLIAGFWKLQVQNPQFYDQRAIQNSIKSVPILAPRGRILDRDGRVIVDNYSSFSLILARESLKEEHLRPIAQGLDLDYTDLVARVNRFKYQPKYVPIVIKEELTPADLSFVDSHHDFFPELVLIQAQRRLYPQNGMLAHVIGYTGEVSEDELDSPDFAKYDPGAVVGKFGIEREYNDWLTGVDGQRQVVVDNRGQVRETLKTKPAVAGKDLQLTIDLDLQAVAELAMDNGVKELGVDHKDGAVVALDPRTGQVLAMVSRPAFDPNKFAVRIKPKDWKEIVDNPGKPLMNKAIQAVQAPGSTFKPFVALAGLESGAIDDKFTVHCSGGVTLFGHYFHCWWKPGHGTVALHTGIVHSCDVYFYTIGSKMGINNISFYGDIAGFGHLTGIDLPHEKEGLMPSEQWKLRVERQKWYAGETPSVAIGQGALTVTPLELARAVGGLAVGGVWHQPHLLVHPQKPEQPVSWTLNPANVKGVIDGMYGVVNEGGGTGGRARLPNVEVCGKTGSAQLASNEYLKGAGAAHANQMKDNAWFEGFAPRDNPEIVVVCLFEHGVHGQYAAPVVRDVIKAYFDKKARLAVLQQQKQALQARIEAMGSLGLTIAEAAPPPPDPDQPVEAAYFAADAPSSPPHPRK